MDSLPTLFLFIFLRLVLVGSLHQRYVETVHHWTYIIPTRLAFFQEGLWQTHDLWVSRQVSWYAPL